ncbi:Metal-dependent hydrolase, endonuclease/exonuclease/phosphatase family [Yoonia litorea]|uniref:Metal-dependent hydrolase, endonuclease/exonuclease/phosphatase family n=2 Tax=Yoonia litorea TaxID=1123755 RepID=A0A1I6LAC7_9RHOB|nr:Metal-dependent hydrolase, endonuclease/exonuclease/phosphatase family [Yoonia litorea]
MRRTLVKAFGAMLFAVVVLVGCQTVRHSGNVPLTAPDPDTLRIATYNVHYIILNREEGAWSVADWERRKEPLDLAFKDIAADVIAFQEMESFGGGSISEVNLTLDWLLSQNADYAAAAVGDPRSFPSTQPILYRTARLAVEDQGWFFFSETPDVIYSRTFNGSYPAFASWAAFTDLTNGQSFTVVNVHTDFGSLSNRLQSAALIAERISPWVAAEETVFVVGDLNARLGDEVVDILKETGLNFAPVEGATFHFNRGLNLFAAIDHIASRGAVRLAAPPIVVRQQYNGEWPTDHYPVVADYAWLSTR